MKRVFVFGAGASCAYRESPYDVQPPLANGFFKAYFNLPLKSDLEVHVGDIANYVRDYLGVSLDDFPAFQMNAEDFMTGLDTDLGTAAARVREAPSTEAKVLLGALARAYDQMVMLFAHVLNHVCSGPVSKAYSALVQRYSQDAAYISFNWDTLLERALWESGRWIPDDGYGVKFRAIMDNGWRDPASPPTPSPFLLKLHGSTNWLVGYVSRNLTTGERQIAVPQRPRDPDVTLAMRIDLKWSLDGVEARPEVYEVSHAVAPFPKCDLADLMPYCYLRSEKPYSTYQNRYRDGFEPFTYFYPPNGAVGDVLTMPLIVPPTRYKLYDEFAHVLDPLWREAARLISAADVVTIIGYSFPPTDVRVAELFGIDPATNNPSRVIEVVNPAPERPLQALTQEMGLPAAQVRHVAQTFEEYLGLEVAQRAAKYRQLSLAEFNAFNPPRGPLVGSVIQERAWFTMGDDAVVGLITYDTVDQDWGYVVLERDASGRYRAIDTGVSRTSFLEAKGALVAAMEDALGS